MPKIKKTDYTNFDRGIESISTAKDLQKLQLPEPTKLISSEDKVEIQLNKFWKPASLENLLKESLLPTISDRDELNPAVYQKRLKDAKQFFIKYLKDERNQKRRPRKPYEEEPEEILEQVINDLEEAESHQDLLWMLKQVVHLA